MLFFAALVIGSLQARAEFPWYEVDSIYDTRDLYMRWAFWRDVPNAYIGANYEYYGVEDCTDSITIDPTRAMLVAARILPWTKEELKQISMMEWRMHKSFRINKKTYRLEYIGDRFGKIRPEVKQMMLELGFQQIAIIDSFVDHGYTPYNIVQRLNEENRYLCLPAPFQELFFEGHHYNWVFAGIRCAANERAGKHPTWNAFPPSTVLHAVPEYTRSLPHDMTPQQYADTLNISLGTMYHAICNVSNAETRHYHEPTRCLGYHGDEEVKLQVVTRFNVGTGSIHIR